ncbi:hypothetical protein B566_EDAN008728 [Ephemera danica]|nr:hypothetical protein B566_EDAN008728 [Ephemera danica]
MTVDDEKFGKVHDTIALEVRMRNDGQASTKLPTSVQQGNKLPQCFAALIVTFAHFISGYAMGWTSPAIGLLAAEGNPLTPTEIGWVGSLFCISASLTTPLAGWLADRLGRKQTVILTAIPFTVAWILQATMAHNITALYIARLCSVTFAHFISGYAMGWTSPAIGLLAAEGNPLTPTEIGWVGSLFCISASLTTPLAGWLADRLGRKQTVILTAIPFTVAWILQATMAHNITALYIARLCSGASAGALVVVPPMYVAETAEPAVRGALTNLLIVMFNTGLLSAYIAGAVLSSTFILSLLGLIPVALFLLGACTWLPETPILLVTKGRTDEARASLRRLRGPHYNVDVELRQLEAAAAADRVAAADESLLRLIRRSRGIRRGLGVTLGLMTCQQLSGISAVLSYTATIFSAAGSQMNPDTCAVVMGALQVVFTLACSGLIDRAGRCPLIIGSSFLLVLALCGLGGYFEAENAGVDVSSLTWLPLAAICLYIVIFSVGLGPVPWVLVGEVFPARVRGTCAALVGMWAWGQAFFVTLAFPPLLAALGIRGAVWLFAGGAVMAGFFSLAFCPETKGKSLEQILQELEGTKSNKFIS